MAVIEEIDESRSDYQVQPQAEPLPVEGEGQEQQPPPPQQSWMEKASGMFFRMFMIYMVMNFFRGKKAPEAGEGGVATVGTKLPSTNLFADGMSFDMYVYISEQPEFGGFQDPSSLVWKKEGLVYGSWEGGPENDGIYTKSLQVTASDALQNNGSIYLHTFVVKEGKSPDPSEGKGKFSKKWTVYKWHRINKYKKKTYLTTANLLTGQTHQSIEDQEKAKTMKSEILSHWHPNVTINIVADQTPWVPGQVPPPLDEFVEFTPSLQQYKPIMWVNDYWNLNRDYMPINSTTPVLNLTLTFQPLTMFKWQMYSAQAMKNRFNVMGNLMGEEEDQDQDSIKEAFLETNHYLLGLTFVVSIVHSVFEFLAFKNDIQFWNNRKSLEGLSVRSVFFNVFQSLIVLLYVLDNDTNSVVRISCFIGLCIELWKITKVSDVIINYENKVLGIFPRISFQDKGNYDASGTKEFDRLAFRYLGAALFPLGVAYMVYSVLYNEHTGWYSFILGSCYGFLLTFGFIMMTPQLFINYKLKSVAHLPWRMMTYKALNTFIDDIFAFVIKMPTMYRLGCFRDDIVFFIMLYQRYIYREDASRVNEFGFSADMLSQKEIEKVSGEVVAEAIEEVAEEKEDPVISDHSEQDGDSSSKKGSKKKQKQKSPKAKKID